MLEAVLIAAGVASVIVARRWLISRRADYRAIYERALMVAAIKAAFAADHDTARGLRMMRHYDGVTLEMHAAAIRYGTSPLVLYDPELRRLVQSYRTNIKVAI